MDYKLTLITLEDPKVTTCVLVYNSKLENSLEIERKVHVANYKIIIAFFVRLLAKIISWKAHRKVPSCLRQDSLQRLEGPHSL